MHSADGDRDGIRLDPNGMPRNPTPSCPAYAKNSKTLPRASNPSKRGLDRYEMIGPSDAPAVVAPYCTYNGRSHHDR